MSGPSTRFKRNLAVIIGINKYRGGISPLRSAVADAKAIARALERDHGFETCCLFDDEARLPRLLALLREELPATLGINDRLLFYFAGHGVALDGDAGPAGYLIPVDASREDRDGFLPMHVVHEELAWLPVRHALVVLDCCFSGAFRWSCLRDVKSSVMPVYRERYDRYLESAAWQVLTSASHDQLAFDRLANDRGDISNEHSPFACALLEGLAGAADYTNDNVITADELTLYARERVATTIESVGSRQVPQLFPLERHNGGQFVFQVPGRDIELAKAPALDERRSPYRGLESFHEEDRACFFGRDAITERLIDAISMQPLTVVVGPSGSGKSSLVHAGVVPALRERGWMVLPTQRPAMGPHAVLGALTRGLGVMRTGNSLSQAAAWLDAVSDWVSRQRDVPWLVIIDQLEELSTYRIAEANRSAFLEALAGAIDIAPSLHVVVTVRSDAEPLFHDTALGPWWTAGRLAVPVMSRDELRDIIEKPAAAAVLSFEPPRLVERLIDDVALVPAPLPLLSFGLSELFRRCWLRWQAGVRDRTLRATDYEEMGSVARALTRTASTLYDQLVEEDEKSAITIRNVFSRMVVVTSGERARRRVPLDELVYDDPDEARRVGDVLQRFHEARLISLGTEPSEGGVERSYAEPMHDELVRGWDYVSRWLDELDAINGARSLLSAVAGAARAWHASGQANSMLWNDSRAELADELGRSQPYILNSREKWFITHSVRFRRSRRRRLVGGLLIVIAVLAIASGVALSESRRAAANAARAEHTQRLEREARQVAQAAEIDARAQSERAAAEADRARVSEQRATDAEAQAILSAKLAQANAAEVRRRLAAAYLETGRQLLLDGWPLKAVPYLVEARKLGQSGATLQLLFAMARRNLPLILEHHGPVVRAVFSPDGARVFTASSDKTARIWDASTGKPISPPLMHQDQVIVAEFSPDGTRVVTVSSGENAARVWDATTGMLVLPTIKHDCGPRCAMRSAVIGAAFSPDGTHVVTASTDGTARVWDATTGMPVLPPLKHHGAVMSAAFSPDGTHIVTASEDGAARVWDSKTGEPTSPPLEHQSQVRSAGFSSDGLQVVTVAEYFARVWDATTGKPVSPPLRNQNRVWGAAFSPDGSRVIIVGDNDNIVRMWDVKNRKLVSASFEHDRPVIMAAFSQDGKRVVTAGADRTARVWDATGGKLLSLPLEHQDLVWSATFSPDGTRVVTASNDGTARVWDATNGQRMWPPLKHQKGVICAAFSSDGTRVITRSNDYTAQVWDAATSKPVAPPLKHQGAVVSAAFSPDGMRVVTASYDRTAQVWYSTTSSPVAPPLEHQTQVESAAFSSNGAHVVTVSADSAQVWDAATGKLLAQPIKHKSRVRNAAFSPDGARVITVSDDNTVQVWNATTSQPVSPPLKHQSRVESAAFSPNGTRFVTLSDDGTVRVWDASTSTPVAPPLEHQNWASAFSPDGTRLVTVSDGTARIWEVLTSKPVAPPLEPKDLVAYAAFSPDGSLLVTVSDGKTAQVWDATTSKPVMSPLEHQDRVACAAFSPDGTRVVTASYDKTAQVWEIPKDRTALADWSAVAARIPYALINGVLVYRTRAAGSSAPQTELVKADGSSIGSEHR